MNKLRLDISSLRADGARVEVSFTTPNGQQVKGAIEQSFFEDFMGQPNPQLTQAHKQRIVSDNEAWLATEAERQLELGYREITIA